MIDYCSLHNYTDYSILNSLISPKDLFNKAKELGQKSIAVTDYGSCAGAWESLKVSREVGVKLIIGCTLYFVDDVAQKDQKFRHIVLLAKNAIGYKNLLTLNKLGFDNSAIYGKRVYPLIDWNLLEQYKDGLICLTASCYGILGQLLMAKKLDETENQLLKLKKIFGEDLGLEIQPNTLKRGSALYKDNVDQIFVNNQMIRLGKKYDVKVVATNNSFYVNKEDYETHDVLLAIGSHQPVSSNFRTKYDCPDFYLKSGDEVKTFFERNYGEEAATEFCTNSIYFADKCEVPDWIDPKFSNPSGKELPEFPVKNELDYEQFLIWLKKQPEDLQKLSEDKLYLRYKCEENIKIKLPNLSPEQLKEYNLRIIEELDVLEYHDFSSYMLITSDYITWAKNNNISVGVGRGCLTANTKVLTTSGFKFLDKIDANDVVYSHTGEPQKILNTFKFDVSNEELLNIKTQYSFDPIVLTKDHKIYGVKNKLTQRFCKFQKENYKSVNKIKKNEIPTNPNWLEASEFEIGDWIYTTYPNHTPDQKLLPKDFEIKYSNTKNSNLDRQAIVSFDNEFIYWLGRFAGDGWYHLSTPSKDSNYIGIAFNSNDYLGIEAFEKYFKNIGLHVGKYKHAKKNLIQLLIHNRDLAQKIAEYFPDYKHTSNTKHLPVFFRNLSNDMLNHLLNGIIDSDGFKNEVDKRNSKHVNRISIDSTSFRLISEVKELLLYLKVKSSISRRKPFKRGEYLCKESFKLRFNRKNLNNFSTDFGYFSKITSITSIKENFVYDITVENDHSYLTTNGIVHNSVGGSLVAYLLDIHQADPIKYNLIFARFHNKEKSSFPDIDTDFSDRDRVEQYCRQKYGDDHVARVSNINTITPKVYARDIARSCEFGGSKEKAVQIGTDIADIFPKEITKINDAFTKVPIFEEYVKRYPQLKTHAAISGKYRAFSTHAAGIVISKRSLVGLVPLRRDKDGVLCLEYDKDKAEENGLVKMDLLGLSTLNVIENVKTLILNNGKKLPEDYPNFDQYDEKTFDIISNGNTFGIFQLGTSSGTIDLCRRIKPKSLNEISYINSLARPSARDMRNDFILTKDGKKPYSLLHPSLKRAFENTFGFGLYEESLFFLAQDVAGWDLHSADRLRKLTKEKGKNPKKAEEWRKEFIEGSIKHGVNEEIAKRIWDEVVSKFQGYGFNNSHSIFYSMIAFSEAYLKAHYPTEFLLAKLMDEVKSNSPVAAGNIVKIKNEIRALKIKIIPPDLNKSELQYTFKDEQLITGLDAIKFVSDDAIKDLIAKRPFKSFQDFMTRVESRKVRANTIQALAAAGALDSFGIKRQLIYLYCSDYRKKLQVWLKKHNSETEEFTYPWPEEKSWDIPQTYAMEYFYLGEGFVSNIKGAYGNFFKEGEFTNFSKIKKMNNKAPIKSIKAVIKDLFEFRVKKEGKYQGQAMAKITLEDVEGNQCGMTVFPDRWSMIQERLKEIHGDKYKFEAGLALHFSGTANLYEDEVGVILDKIYNIQPFPQKPIELKAKKVALKKKEKEPVLIKDPNRPQEEIWLEQIEDELINEGFIDFDEDND